MGARIEKKGQSRGEVEVLRKERSGWSKTEPCLQGEGI